jgi:NAD-dependent dihydropyrimidine dehydrogenase PreA subunit
MNNNDEKSKSKKCGLSRRKFLEAGVMLGLTTPLLPKLSFAEALPEGPVSGFINPTNNILNEALSRLSIHHTLWSDANKLCSLSKEIFNNTESAKIFYADPKLFLSHHGLSSLDPDSIEIRLAISLGDPEINHAIKSRDPQALVKHLYNKGLINTINKSALKEKVEKSINCQLKNLNTLKDKNFDDFSADLVSPAAVAIGMSIVAVAYIYIAIETEIYVSGGGSGSFSIDQETCINCGACDDACPTSAIYESGSTRDIDSSICIGCGDCVPTCPVNAISEDSSSASLYFSSLENQSTSYHNKKIARYFSLPRNIKNNPGLGLAAILGDQEFMGKTTIEYINSEIEKAAQAIEEIELYKNNYNSPEELRNTLKENFARLMACQV